MNSTGWWTGLLLLGGLYSDNDVYTVTLSDAKY